MVGCSAGAGNDNVVVDIFGAATANPFIYELFYSTDIVGHTGVFFASTTTLSFTEPVPEPSSLLVLYASLTSLALFGRKRGNSFARSVRDIG